MLGLRQREARRRCGMAVEVGAVRRRSDERVQKEERRGMAQSRQKFAFARCGASVALAATLSLSMVPATALAEVDSDAQGGGGRNGGG